MSIYQIATKYLGGEFAETNGLGVNDAVHVLATTFQVSKPDLRAAIYSLMEEDVVLEPVVFNEPNGAAVEGADIDEEFFKNYP